MVAVVRIREQETVTPAEWASMTRIWPCGLPVSDSHPRSPGGYALDGSTDDFSKSVHVALGKLNQESEIAEFERLVEQAADRLRKSTGQAFDSSHLYPKGVVEIDAGISVVSTCSPSWFFLVFVLVSVLFAEARSFCASSSPCMSVMVKKSGIEELDPEFNRSAYVYYPLALFEVLHNHVYKNVEFTAYRHLTSQLEADIRSMQSSSRLAWRSSSEQSAINEQLEENQRTLSRCVALFVCLFFLCLVVCLILFARLFRCLLVRSNHDLPNSERARWRTISWSLALLEWHRTAAWHSMFLARKAAEAK